MEIESLQIAIPGGEKFELDVDGVTAIVEGSDNRPVTGRSVYLIFKGTHSQPITYPSTRIENAPVIIKYVQH